MKVFSLILIFIFLNSCENPNPNEPELEMGALAFSTSEAPDDVARVDGRLTRDGFSDVTFGFTIQNGEGSAVIDEIEEGQWVLNAEAFSSDSIKTYEGSTSVNVIAGQQTDVALVLEPVENNTGSIKINVVFGLRQDTVSYEVNSTSLTVNWSTNIKSTASIFYKKVTDSAYTEIVVSDNLKSHTSIITGLDPETDYIFYVASKAGTQSKTSSSQSFTTGKAATNSGLLISEYIEGSSNNKAIEIYNGTAADIDLSNYVVGLFSNGSSTVGNTYNAPSGTILKVDSVYVIANSGAVSGIKNLADVESNITWYNGDDALAIITKESFDLGVYVYVDIFGVIGVDPGSSWTNTQNKTLRRKLTVTEGVSSNPASFDTSVEWNVLDQDTFDGLGKR